MGVVEVVPDCADVCVVEAVRLGLEELAVEYADVGPLRTSFVAGPASRRFGDVERERERLWRLARRFWSNRPSGRVDWIGLDTTVGIGVGRAPRRDRIPEPELELVFVTGGGDLLRLRRVKGTTGDRERERSFSRCKVRSATRLILVGGGILTTAGATEDLMRILRLDSELAGG